MNVFPVKLYVRVVKCGEDSDAEFSILRGGHDNAHEDIGTLLYMNPTLLLSKRQEQFPDGSVFAFVLTASLVYTQDYWGECDFDLEPNKVRLLWSRKPTRKQQRRDAFRARSHSAAHGAQ